MYNQTWSPAKVREVVLGLLPYHMSTFASYSSLYHGGLQLGKSAINSMTQESICDGSMLLMEVAPALIPVMPEAER